MTTSSQGEAARFRTTDWKTVFQVRGPEREAALELLCRQYWPPLFVYVRRCGLADADARDLTQAFIVRWLEKDLLRQAAPERGRLRTFLLVALRNFMRNEARDGRRLCRGGGRQVVSLDDSSAGLIDRLASGEGSPDGAYDRAWVELLLERVLTRLEAEQVEAGHARRFLLLKPLLAGDDGSAGYSQIAAELGVSQAAARQAASRLRQRFRDLLRAEVAATLVEPADVDDEIAGLFRALAPPR